jgi:hypothetical protein
VESVRESQACVQLYYREDEELCEGDALPDVLVPDQALRHDNSSNLPNEANGQNKQQSHSQLQRDDLKLETFPMQRAAESQVRAVGQVVGRLFRDVHEPDMREMWQTSSQAWR